MNKIFNIGISKTGLTSVSEALRILGFSGIHYPNPSQLRDFDLGKFDFGSDMPFMYEYEYYDKLFPDSKFICTIRTDADQWLKSVKNQHERTTLNNMKNFEIDYRRRMYGIYTYDIDNQLEVRRNHYSNIFEYFKNRKEDILVLDIFSDPNPWISLCKFLSVDIPNANFPRLNQSV